MTLRNLKVGSDVNDGKKYVVESLPFRKIFLAIHYQVKYNFYFIAHFFQSAITF